MLKFFVDKDRISGGRVSITGSDVRHFGVLRMTPGDEFAATDGAHAHICRIASINKDEVIADILYSAADDTEPAVEVTLFQGIPKADKMELIIQKTVELGIFRIVPMVTERSIPVPSENKIARWKKISESAAKQSGRGIIPEVCSPVSFEQAARMLEQLAGRYAAWEQETETTASAVFSDSQDKTAGIAIGPEGGFSNDEILMLKQCGIKTFSLGKRILRTETAGFAALICLMMHRGEL
jgi:16S rRNA (uracil1498-N3)-methyltransferase